MVPSVRPCCEAKEQELHEARIELSRCKAVMRDMEDEIMMEKERRQEVNSIPQPLSRPVQLPCTDCEASAEEFELKLASLTKQLEEERKLVKELKSDLRDTGLEVESLRALQQQDFKLQLASSEEKIEELLVLVDDKDNELKHLKKVLEEKNEEVEDVRAESRNLRSEMAQLNELVQELTCEKAQLTSELAASKASADPSDRGNSLFSEVEDHRKKAVAQFQLLNSKYNSLKIELGRNKDIIKAQEAQLWQLSQSLENGEKEKLASALNKISTQNNIIQELKMTNSQLEKLLSDKSKDTSHKSCAYATLHNMVSLAQDVSAKLLKEKTNLSMERYALMEKQWSAEGSCSNMKKRLAKMEAEMAILQNSHKDVLDQLTTAQQKILQESSKENIGKVKGVSNGSKGVSFSTDTKVSDGDTKRMRPKPKEFPIYKMHVDPATGRCQVVEVNPKKDKTEFSDKS